MNPGDYVLATKYGDGDPGDQWCIGFFSGTLPRASGDRHMVVDGDGRPFRGNGFRRVRAISPQEGDYLLARIHDIDASQRSLWDWLADAETAGVGTLSPEEQARRAPPPPDERVGALHGQVHRDVGRARAAKSVKASPASPPDPPPADGCTGPASTTSCDP